MALNLGAMRHEVRIERRTTTQQASGQPEDTWLLVAERRAERIATTGTERDAAQQEIARVPTVFKIRYLEGVLPSMRLTSGGKLYDIKSAVPDPLNVELVITCEELVGEEAPS